MHRLVIVWMVALAACTETVADNAIRACQPLCQCGASPLPSVQRDCNEDCTMLFERDPLAESCIVCLVEHRDRCTTLLGDCTAICNQPAPLPSYVTTGPATGIVQ